MPRTLRAAYFLPALLLAACGDDPATPGGGEPHPDGLAVLFVGNSLTYQNELPAMVGALVEAAGLPRPRIGELTRGNYSLEDHWAEGSLQELLGTGEWDYVVLQQGPSSLPENQEHLARWTREIHGAAAPAGTRVALYMVWPDRTRFFAFDDVRASYSAAAEAVDGVFLPAGEAWRLAWGEDASAPLYGPDGFHPAVAGTYAAALVMVEGLWGRSPLGLPASFDIRGHGRVTLDEDLAALLQRAAAEANARWGRP